MDYSQRVKIEYAILCQSIYSDRFQLFMVGTYSVRIRVWFTVFSNDIFKKS